MRTCPICTGPMRSVGTAQVLNRHQVGYDYCDGCHFWCTEEPYWLDEAYSEAIGMSDTGLVARNLLLAKRFLPLLSALYGTEQPFVDWAGGYGMFVRLMRDRGLNFLWQDRYSANLLAKGFEFDSKHRGSIAAITAIEALEHAPDPIAFVQEIFDATGSSELLLTQELHHGVDFDWWYLSPDGGQHVSFFDARTLDVLAERVGVRVLSHRGVHLLTKTDVSARRFELLCRTARLRYPVVSRRLHGLTWDDHLALRKHR